MAIFKVIDSRIHGKGRLDRISSPIGEFYCYSPPGGQERLGWAVRIPGFNGGRQYRFPTVDDAYSFALRVLAGKERICRVHEGLEASWGTCDEAWSAGYTRGLCEFRGQG